MYFGWSVLTLVVVGTGAGSGSGVGGEGGVDQSADPPTVLGVAEPVQLALRQSQKAPA